MADSGMTEEGLAPAILEIYAVAKRQPSDFMWYRGQPDGLPLLPSVLRDEFLDQAEGLFPDSPSRTSAGFSFEQMINLRFLRRAAKFLESPSDLSAAYFSAQHYGLQTRLLDWTTEPFVALYFASQGSPTVNGRVFSIITLGTECEWTDSDGQTLQLSAPLSSSDTFFHRYLPGLFSQSGTGKTEGGVVKTTNSALGDGVVPVFPHLSLERIASQGSCFTFHPIPKAGSEVKPSILADVFVPGEQKERILNDLSILGVTKDSVYPGIESVASAVYKEVVRDRRLWNATVSSARRQLGGDS